MAALVWLFCLFVQAARADDGDRWSGLTHTAFKHHNHPDISSGLCFAQDRQGFLWIGTQSGLVRWDGNRHVKYVANATRDDALPDSYILSLHIDRRGQLWAGMNSGGLVRYDAQRDSFVRYRVGPGGLGDTRVSAITDDGAGGLWVGTGSGLDHIDARGAVTPLARTADAALPAGGIDALLRDRSGVLWAGTRQGLFRMDSDQPAQQVALAGAPEAAVNVLAQDSTGRIWIGTRTNGAYAMAPGAGGVAAAVRESGPAPTLQSERVMAIVEAAPGEIWLGTDGSDGGIVVVDTEHGATRRIRHQSETPDSLAESNVLALFRERSGIVYAATMVGVSQHDPQPRAVTTIRHLGPRQTGALSVPTMLAAPDGRLWLGLISGGAAIIDPHLGLVRQLAPGAGLPQARVLAIVAGPDGEIYVGTQKGLYRADADGGHTRLVHLGKRGASAEVWALAVVGRTLWVGGLDGLRTFALPAADDARPLRQLRHEEISLGDPRVTALLPQGDAVWVGTRTGLARVHAAGVETIPSELAAPDRLPPGYVSSLLLDGQGRLWLSTFGTGVVVLERTDADGRRRFRRLGMAQGLPDNGANMLLRDGQGMVWASTDTGLARIDPRSLAIRTLGQGDGVHIATYWTNSGAVTRAGELAFGGLSGVTVVRPQELTAWHYAAPVVVTRILLSDKEMPIGPYNLGDGTRAAPITVTPAGRERGFALEFAALDYSAPERNRYAYRLKGFDPDWVDTEASVRRASYNNLPPGDYVLQLRGSNRNGDWSTPLEVPVRMLPAWHQQPLARLALAVLGLAMVAGLMHMRTAYLRRRQRELEATVQARTAELRATQAQLETGPYSDPRPGLANRRLFTDELRHLVAQAERGGPGFTLLLIDLDRFKPINDTYGHDAGDALLVAAADRLRAAVRVADRPFRLGGDEFAVLLSQTTARETMGPVCMRILDNLAQPLQLAPQQGGAEIAISASVGAAVHQRGDSHEQLYKQADLALYHAKDAGRNAWRLATPRNGPLAAA
ncbi:MAG: two-component regulator propeller domain-containing protein [Duganella sp.]